MRETPTLGEPVVASGRPPTARAARIIEPEAVPHALHNRCSTAGKATLGEAAALGRPPRAVRAPCTAQQMLHGRETAHLGRGCGGVGAAAEGEGGALGGQAHERAQLRAVAAAPRRRAQLLDFRRHAPAVACPGEPGGSAARQGVPAKAQSRRSAQ